MMLLRWVVLASVGTIAACGGVSDIGSGSGGKGGSSAVGGTSVVGTGGGHPVGGTSVVGMGGGHPVGGTGSGATPGVEACETAMDCKLSLQPCEPCRDGSYACPTAVCEAGKCVVDSPSCHSNCSTDMDCPVLDIACENCADGSLACPISQCIMGQCETSLPTCGSKDPCQGLSCGERCLKTAADGMPDEAAPTFCTDEGKCTAGTPVCEGPNTCQTAMDCPTAPPNCIDCGNDQCAGMDCISGKCVFTCPPNPDPECKTVMDCPIIGDQCYPCAGDLACAVQACISGSCELVCPLP